MSRIGKQPVVLSEGVTANVNDDTIIIKGPKGELSVDLLPTVKAEVKDATVVITRIDEESKSKAEHGLIRSLVQNAATGVKDGFSKKLEVNGVGFKLNLQGKKLVMQLGFSHPVEYTAPEGIDIAVEENTGITVSGMDKQQVGQVAAEIRAFKKPEPYKGKGIKYADEHIIRKAGKAAGAEA